MLIVLVGKLFIRPLAKIVKIGLIYLLESVGFDEWDWLVVKW